MLNHFPDAVCLNEVYWDTEHLPEFYRGVRECIARGEAVADRVDGNGRPSTDATRDGVSDRTIRRPLSDRFLVGHKGGANWLVQLPRVLRHGFPTLAIVRDPVLTIASWSQPRLSGSLVARMTGDEMFRGGWQAWNGLTLSFQADPAASPVERRAMLWNCLACTLIDLRERIKIVRYEELVTCPQQTCADIAQWLDTDPPCSQPVIQQLDWTTRYGEALIDECRAAVVRFAPLRCAFGYT